MKPFNVLSLFDGISCGQLSLQQAGIPINKYYASEIDKNAIQITQKNFPNTIQIGDIRDINANDYKHIDIIIGGSSCTDFSMVGLGKGMITKEGIEVTSLKQYLKLKEDGFQFEGQSYLFWEYMRLLQEIKPTYFLLENVKMSKKWKQIITDTLGIEPKLIDSALLSPQHRERNYWTNIPILDIKAEQIVLDDILIHTENPTEVAHCKTIEKAVPLIVEKYGFLPEKFNAYNKSIITSKSPTLSTGSMVTSSCATTLFVPNDKGEHSVKNGIITFLGQQYKTMLFDGNYTLRALLPLEAERLQTLPDNYTLGVSNRQRFKTIGNCWTVKVTSHIMKGLLLDINKAQEDIII